MALTLANVKRGQAKQVRGDRAPDIDATWWAKGVDLTRAIVKRGKAKSKIKCRHNRRHWSRSITRRKSNLFQLRFGEILSAGHAAT